MMIINKENNYQDKAIKFAEKYGVADFRQSGRIMSYLEDFPEGKYHVEVDLDTLNEKRTLIVLPNRKQVAEQY